MGGDGGGGGGVGGGVGVEDVGVVMVEAKEVGEDAQRTRASWRAVQAFLWGP